jgi:casein kinase II subunit alpha
VKTKKILREVKILKDLQGGPNVIPLLDVIRDSASKTPAFVFEYIDYEEHKTLYPKFSLDDIKFYMFEVLKVKVTLNVKTLDYAHSRGIFHRDIKPNNLIINHDKKQLKVIDWGLAEYFIPENELNVRVKIQIYVGC